MTISTHFPAHAHRRATRSVGVAGAALLVSSMVVASPPAEATPATLPGIIVFQRADQADQWQLWVANADLSNERQISAGPYTSGFATWNADGTRIAFDSNRSDPDLSDDVGVNDVFTMNPDGSDVVQVTDSGSFAGDPGWSPDGQWLTFESDFNDYFGKAGIWISRPDGSHLRRITAPADVHDGYWDTAPQFSPDGKRLVFTRAFSFDDEGNIVDSALYVVDVDGTHARELTATRDLLPGDANWSPDGRTLTFETSGFPATIRADGTHLRDLTPQRAEGYAVGADPVYSPDGRQIMLLRAEFTSPVDVISSGLSVMGKNGNQLRYLPGDLTQATEEHQPDWVLAPRLGPASSRSAATHDASPPVAAQGHTALDRGGTPSRTLRRERH